MDRWVWIRDVKNSRAEFNANDFNNGKSFWIIDNETGQVHCLRNNNNFEDKNIKYLYIPSQLQTQEFIDWLLLSNYEVFKYLEPKLITAEAIRNALCLTKSLSPIKREELFSNISYDQWLITIRLYPFIFKDIPDKYKIPKLTKEYALVDYNCKYNGGIEQVSLLPRSHHK